MVKKLMCGLALMGCAMSSQAAVQGFDWTFSGFTPHWSSEMTPWGEDGHFDPSTTFTGRFFAEDLDKNGSFSLSEVTLFSIGGQSKLDCKAPERCGLTTFSYTPGSVLNFDAYDVSEYGQWGSGWSRYTNSYRTGSEFYSVTENDWSMSGARSYSYVFKPETKFAISAISAVPEPQTWLMMGAGLALLGAAKRRRSRKA
ncbi:PEP-CTERM sorting domain-containing protein [Massilia pseudoviolaceinigra]|uniref:PEP-CTERM sorting domain-containing protein n=1 Tax=Massilia pseudoviolaceinigra TaxID=3057165 RepID=UPI00279696AE|nr:PEP-CTERM sorting domain-containing protein [Massilia sp. CCM 9206]MDQ1922513.1 PEP-CTERM sorting domain-containing protein [Massilia sp. CCM 9206]